MIILGNNEKKLLNCERFEPRNHFKSSLSMIVRVNVVLDRTRNVIGAFRLVYCHSVTVVYG